MHILFVAVNAKYIHSNPAVYGIKAYVDTMLEEHLRANPQNRISIAEYTINERVEDIMGDIYERQPDVVAFSCYIWNWGHMQSLIKGLHELSPQIPLLLGGPEVSYTAEEIMKEYPYLHSIMVGEGEETWVSLASYFWGFAVNLKGVAGLYYQGQHTGERKLLALDELAFPYQDLEPFHNRIVYYETSRGCPYRCSYCLSSETRAVRLRKMELVKAELQFFLDQRLPQVKLIDRTFNCNREHAREIWRYLLENDNGVTNFHFEIAADLIEDEDLQMISRMRPGAIQLEIGIQTTNPEVLLAVHRHNHWEQIVHVVKTIRSFANTHQHLDLIAGLPQEGFESFQKSFNEVYSLRPDQLQLGFLKVLKGSEMYRRATELGILFMPEAPYEVLQTRWIRYEELRILKNIENMVEIYYNSGQFQALLEEAVLEYPSPFHFYEALANYYREAGYMHQSSGRMQKYDLLLEMLCEGKGEARKERYRQLAIWDLYRRENLKSRPVYAPDLREHYAQIMRWYEEEIIAQKVLCISQGQSAKQLAKLTHMEVFTTDGGSRFILFDYQRRSPLSNDAMVIDLGNLYEEMDKERERTTTTPTGCL